MLSTLALVRTRVFAASRRAVLCPLATQASPMTYGTLRVPDDRDYNDFEAHRFEEHIAELKRIYEQAHPKMETTESPKHRFAREVEPFALEAPDGTSDDEVDYARRQVEQIIRFAAQHEDIDEVINEHQRLRKDQFEARKIFAVDAPDGTPDIDFRDEAAMAGSMDTPEEGSPDSIDQSRRQALASILMAHAGAYRVGEPSLQDVGPDGSHTFAIDAPDGTSDDEILFARKQVNQIIRFAAEHEDIDEVIREHQRNRKIQFEGRRVFAVDGPDGLPDIEDEMTAGRKQVQQIIRFAAEHEDIDEVIREHQRNRKDELLARKIFAVDAPDGSSDADSFPIDPHAEMEKALKARRDAYKITGRGKLPTFAFEAPDGTPDDAMKREQMVVDQIVRYAAENEDKDTVIAEHQRTRKDRFAASKVFAVEAPDGTPDVDDEAISGKKQVEQIIRFAAEHEDKDEVIREHQRNRKDQFEAGKIFAVDAPDGIPDIDSSSKDPYTEMESIAKAQRDSYRIKGKGSLPLFAFEAPDGTPDDAVKRERMHVDQIIYFAAEHEDIDNVISEHQRNRKDQFEARKIFAVDAPDGIPDIDSFGSAPLAA